LLLLLLLLLLPVALIGLPKGNALDTHARFAFNRAARTCFMPHMRLI
jgi:hypothetical protein